MALASVVFWPAPSAPAAEPPSGRDRLAAATGPWRTGAGRLTGGFEYAAPAAATPRVLPGDGAVALVLLAAEITAAAAKAPSLETLSALGRLRLVQGQPERAIAAFEEALRRGPASAPLGSDLAAAYLARAKADGAPLDLVLALEAAQRAADADPRLAEARFNRALAVEGLGLVRTARRQWAEYLTLDLDPASAWAAEARGRATALAEPAASSSRAAAWEQAVSAGDEARLRVLAAEQPHQARLYLHDRGLPGWADAVHAGHRAEARNRLRSVRILAASLKSQGQGGLLEATVAAIDAAQRRGADGTARLAAAHRDFRDGAQHYAARRIGQALDSWQRARAAFVREGSPYAAPAAFYIACCAYYHQRFAEAEQELQALSSRAGAEDCPHLAARMQWMVGLTRAALGRPGESLRPFDEARRLFVQAGDGDGVAAAEGLIANSLKYLGRTAEAWTHRQRALDAVRAGDAAGRAPLLFAEAARAAHAEGHSLAALFFRDEHVERQRERDDLPGLVDALLFRASIHFELGHRELAEADLAEASRVILALPDADLRAQKGIALALTEGEILTTGRPEAAVERLTRVVEFYRARGQHDLLLPAQRVLARALLRAGRQGEAAALLDHAIDEREAQGSSLVEDRVRAAFFDRQQDAFDERVALEVAQGRTLSALSYAERSRARALRRGPPLDWAAWQAGRASAPVPPGTAVLEYALSSDRLFVWVLRGRDVQLVTAPADPARIQDETERLRAGLTRGAPPESWRDAAGALFDLLVAPVLKHVEPADRLVLVPHRLLASVPFGALVDPGTGRLLLQDRDLTISWSASVYMEAAAVPGAKDWGAAEVLIVGNPAVDRTLLPWTPPLPGADDEADAVAMLYPRAVRLGGAEATPSRFLEAARRSEVVHFAGHAEAGGPDPGLARLLLAPDRRWPGDSGLLYAQDLLGQDLSRTRLIVLASCSSATGPLSASEGAMGLARYFLAAGVSWVVASQWPVDDQASAWLMTEFHRRLRTSGDPQAALRGAQVAMMSHPDRMLRSPSHWAAFALFGGSRPAGPSAPAGLHD